jgi:Curli production assembly/transport component CsgG
VKRAGLLGLVLALAIPGAAGATTVSGSLAGATLPKKGKGVVAVRAINVESGQVGGAKRTRTGAFSLRLAPASYLVIGSIVPRRGKATVANTRPLSVRVTTKPKRNLKVRFKKRKRKRHNANASNTPGVSVDVDYAAIWVKKWDVSDANVEYRVLAKGMQDMLITDLVNMGPPTCAKQLTIVDRDAWDLILKEQQLQQSGAVDPSTAVEPGKLIEPNVFITGKVRTSGDQLTLDAKIEDTLAKRTYTATVTGAALRVFQLEADLAAQLGNLLCNPPPEPTCQLRQVCQGPPGPVTPSTPTGHPVSYTGTVSGSRHHVQDTSINTTISWSGPVTYGYVERHQVGQGNAPPGDYWWFQPTSGTLHVTVSGHVEDCALSGEGDITVTTGAENTSSVQADTATPYYFLQGIFGPYDGVQYTASGPSCNGGTMPLYGMAWLSTKDALPSSSTTLTGSAEQNLGPGLDDHWSWNFSPQY